MPLIVQAPGLEDRIFRHIIAAIGSTNVSRIGIVMAWVSRPGLHALRGYLEAQTIGTNPTHIDIVLGNNPHMRYSHRSALVDLLEMSTNENINVRITSSLTTFHPKMILVQGPEDERSSHLFVGSANWTGPGFGVEGVTTVNAEIVAYTHSLHNQSRDFLAAVEGLDWFINDENSFQLDQQFIDDYEPIRPSRNPVVRERLEQPPPIDDEFSDEQEEELLAESETLPTALSLPNSQDQGSENSNLVISEAIARFLSLIGLNADDYQCNNLHQKLNGLNNKSGHVMRSIPLALKFVYECQTRQEVLRKIRDLDFPSNYSTHQSSQIRQTYQTEWKTWLETIDDDDELPRVRNTAGVLTWTTARGYFHESIGGNDDYSRSQAELTASIYIIAHLTQLQHQGADE